MRREADPFVIPANVIFGLLAAFLWGGGDFSGGMAAKHAGGTLRGALRIILVSHSTSLAILIAVALLRGDTFPQGAPLRWAIVAGVTGGLSIACFYIALARGTMGVSAAVSGLLAATIPAFVSILLEGPPGSLRLIGFVVAGLAIWLVAAAPAGILEGRHEANARSPIGLAIFAGAGFGVYFVALRMAGKAGVLWPLALSRMVSLATTSVFLFLITMSSKTVAKAQRLASVTILWALLTALLDTGGNFLFVLATRSGRLDVAAVLASLYPATTILLAGLVLKERFSQRQVIGMAVAAAAILMITQ